MRRSLFAGIGVAAVLVLAACTDRAQDRAPLTPTGPSLAQSPLCSNSLASDIVKQQKALYTGAALTDVAAKFDLVKAACPGVAGDDELMNYLEATITHRPDTVKTITEARAKLIVALWKSVTTYYAPPADLLDRPFTVLMASGGAEVLSPGESMTTFDQGAKLKLDDNSTPSIQHLFTFEQKPTSECDGTTSLNVTRNGASLQGNGTGCYDVKDYPHETLYTPSATITLCLKQGSETDEEIGLVHQRSGFGAELLQDVTDSHSCIDFHATNSSWLRTNGGPFGRAVASLYDYLRPRPLFADDVGESGSIGLFSLVGASLNEIFADDISEFDAFPDVGDSWTAIANSPGYIQFQNSLGDLSGGVVVLSQALGNCPNCPVFSLLGKVENSNDPDSVGTYEVTWQSVQDKPSVKEAPFILLNKDSVEIARVSYVSRGSDDLIMFKVGTDSTDVTTWTTDEAQSFKLTLSLKTLSTATSYKVSLSVDGGTPVVKSSTSTVANSLKQLGYILTGIDAGVIGAKNFRVLRVSDIP